jgi:FSR family fosmidomycin resistance protein-like MFS transporter
MNIESKLDSTDFQKGDVLIVSSAHAVNDTYTGFLPALLPVLIEKFSLSNTAAGALSLGMQLPSLLQPLIGRLADNSNLRYLLVLAPAITGAALSSLGIAPGYAFLFFLVVLAGVSNAMLHAIGPVLVSTFSGFKLGKGMSFWMVGGELGRVLGPLVIVTILGFMEMEKLPLLMMAGFLASSFLAIKLNHITTQQTEGNHHSIKVALRGLMKVMLPLSLLIISRSMWIASLNTFLPTFLRSEGSTLFVAGASLSIYQTAGVLGSLLIGPLSDRVSRSKLLTISFLITPLLMFAFIQTQGLIKIPILILIGFFGISITPVLMAIVMENSHENRSFANGVYMAVSFIFNALAVLLVGWISDLIGLRTTFMISAGILALGLPSLLFLPKSPKVID